MLEGLLICVVGMVVVFIALAILMYVIMGLEKFLRGGELAVEEVAVGVPVEAATAIREPIVVGKDEPKPEDTVEVAAITVVIASYLRERGKELGKRININGVSYDVDVAELHAHPISVVVSGERFRASLNEEGLPLGEEAALKLEERAKYAKQSAGWRSAYSPSSGDYWCRRGWTGRRAGKERE